MLKKGLIDNEQFELFTITRTHLSLTTNFIQLQTKKMVFIHEIRKSN